MTGVEDKPGHKDPRKLRQFVAEARAAGEMVADRHIDLTQGDDVPGVTRPWDWQLDD